MCPFLWTGCKVVVEMNQGDIAFVMSRGNVVH